MTTVSSIESLRLLFRGTLLEPARPGYDEARRVHNGLVDKRPALIFPLIAQWLDPAESDACIAWARKTYSAMQPFFASGRYVNYLGDDEGGDSVAAAYGPSYDRLRRIKKRYDPGNVFRLNQNIAP